MYVKPIKLHANAMCSTAHNITWFKFDDGFSMKFHMNFIGFKFACIRNIVIWYACTCIYPSTYK